MCKQKRLVPKRKWRIPSHGTGRRSISQSRRSRVNRRRNIWRELSGGFWKIKRKRSWSSRCYNPKWIFKLWENKASVIRLVSNKALIWEGLNKQVFLTQINYKKSGRLLAIRKVSLKEFSIGIKRQTLLLWNLIRRMLCFCNIHRL